MNLAGKKPLPASRRHDATEGQISATEAVFTIHDSRVGNGAGVQVVELSGLSGSDTDTTYYALGFCRVGTPYAPFRSLKGVHLQGGS